MPADTPLAVFRADAGLPLGNGHVMRCLTLANALRQRGYRSLFVCRAHPGHLAEQVRDSGHEICLLPLAAEAVCIGPDDPPHAAWLGADWALDAQQTQAALAGRRASWLILDHYALDARWENALRPHCAQLMVLDDLADRAHACDLLLDQTLGRSPAAYAGKVPAACALLTGAEYALLRPEFAALRSASLARRSVEKRSSLFVSMGGVDAGNASASVLAALHSAALPANCRITVVLGAHAPALPELRAQAERMPWPTRVLAGVSNMAELMAEADLAIAAAGSTAWERCCLGLPSVMLVLAANQRQLAQALADAGAALLLGEAADLAERLPAMLAQLAQPGALQQMSARASGLVDGRGTERVLQFMIGEPV